MRQALAAILAVATATACTTTTYRTRQNDDVELRLTAKKSGETLIRPVKAELWHHYFLLGLISKDDPVDLAEALHVRPGQAVVNLRVVNTFAPVDVLVTFGLGILTFGIAPAIWSTRTTEIRGELVELNKDVAPPQETRDAAPEAATAAPTPSPARPATSQPALPAGWSWGDGAQAFAAAGAACAANGGALPTRADLKALQAATPALKDGDVWTADTQDDDVWSYSFDGGVTFLKSPKEKMAVLCVKERKAP